MLLTFTILRKTFAIKTILFLLKKAVLFRKQFQSILNIDLQYIEIRNKLLFIVCYVKLLYMFQCLIFQYRFITYFDILLLTIRPTLSKVECMHIMFINYKLMLGHNILHPKGTKHGYPHFTSGHRYNKQKMVLRKCVPLKG